MVTYQIGRRADGCRGHGTLADTHDRIRDLTCVKDGRRGRKLLAGVISSVADAGRIDERRVEVADVNVERSDSSALNASENPLRPNLLALYAEA